MNFVGSESDWCHACDPEEERHEELFNGYDLQCPWNEAENDELQDDKKKKPKWREENDYEKVATSFDGAKSEVWDQARTEANDYCNRLPLALKKSHTEIAGNELECLFTFFCKHSSLVQIVCSVEHPRQFHLQFLLRPH